MRGTMTGLVLVLVQVTGGRAFLVDGVENNQVMNDKKNPRIISLY